MGRVSAIQQERDIERREAEARMEEKLRENRERHSLEEARVWVWERHRGEKL